jgi:hypothetical protein
MMRHEVGLKDKTPEQLFDYMEECMKEQNEEQDSALDNDNEDDFTFK